MDIEALAKKAGMVTEWHAGAASCVWTNGIAGVSAEELKAFAALVAKEEREACRDAAVSLIKARGAYGDDGLADDVSDAIMMRSNVE